MDIESVDGDGIRIAEAASGWRNPKKGDAIEVKIASRTLYNCHTDRREKKK